MIDFAKYIPSLCDEPFMAKTKYGEREMVFDSRFCFWRFTDCTHPLQNMCCHHTDIYEWEYLDKSKMEDLCFIKNEYQRLNRQKDGEILLKNEIKKTFLSKIKKLLTIGCFLLSLKSFSQSKDSISIKIPVGKVIVEFQDSSTYVNFINYLGSIPVSSPYSQLFNYFKSLPAIAIKK